MEQIEGTIQQFDPSVRRLRLHPPGSRGAMVKAVLGMIRVASEPLTMREIADQIAIGRGWDMTNRKRIAVLVEQLRTLLWRQKANGTIAERMDGERRVWVVAG